MSVNKVILMGRLGQDPEIRYLPGGQAVCNFSVATTESWNDREKGQKQEKTEWHRIVVWGKLAELCKQYLAKGRQVFLEGKLQTRSWDDKSGGKRYTTEIVAQVVQFIGSSSQPSTTNSQGLGAAPSDWDHGAASSSSSDFSAGPSFSGGGQYKIDQDNHFTADDIPF